MGRIVFDFLGVAFLCSAVFAIIAYFFPNLGSPSGAVSTVIGAMIAGQLHGRRTGEEVSSGFAWKVAALLTVVLLAVSGSLLAILKAQGDPVLADASAGLILGILAFLGLLSFFAIRFTFRWSVAQGVRTLK